MREPKWYYNKELAAKGQAVFIPEFDKVVVRYDGPGGTVITVKTDWFEKNFEPIPDPPDWQIRKCWVGPPEKKVFGETLADQYGNIKTESMYSPHDRDKCETPFGGTVMVNKDPFAKVTLDIGGEILIDPKYLTLGPLPPAKENPRAQ